MIVSGADPLTSAFHTGYKRLELGDPEGDNVYSTRYERIRRELQQQRVEQTVGVRGQNKVSARLVKM